MKRSGGRRERGRESERHLLKTHGAPPILAAICSTSLVHTDINLPPRVLHGREELLAYRNKTRRGVKREMRAGTKIKRKTKYRNLTHWLTTGRAEQ